jgi:hypothetical protein
VRAFELSSGRAIGDEPFAQLGDALFGLPLLEERPAEEDDCMRAEEGSISSVVRAKSVSASSRARPTSPRS